MPVQPSTTALLEFLELAESAYTPEDRARERRQRNRARAHGTASPTEENHEEDLQWIIRNMDYNRRWDYTRTPSQHHPTIPSTNMPRPNPHSRTMGGLRVVWRMDSIRRLLWSEASVELNSKAGGDPHPRYPCSPHCRPGS